MKNKGLLFLLIVFLTSCNNKSQKPIDSQRCPTISSTMCDKNNTEKSIDSQKELKIAVEKLKGHYNYEVDDASNKFLFIEVITEKTAKIIKKNEDVCPCVFIRIDFPMYSFENPILVYWDSNFKPEIKDTKAILGTGVWYGDDYGDGGSTGLVDIHSFPFYYGETAIYNIDSSKTVLLRHLNTYYRVLSGESIVDSFLYTEDFANCNRIVKEKFLIRNHGLISKNDLKFRK